MYADIVFPTAVRSIFTYQISEEFLADSPIGKRAWVPFRDYYAIGVVVKIHNQQPEFETRPVRQILDDEPVVSQELLELTKWMHEFYYCSWGEVIQAALPAGLNFISEKYLRVNDDAEIPMLTSKEQEVFDEVKNNSETKLDEAKKRWKETGLNRSLTSLLKKGILEIWEEPEKKFESKKEKLWKWTGDEGDAKAERYISCILDDYNKWQEALSELIFAGLPKRDSELKSLASFDSYTKKKLQNDGWITFEEIDAQAITPGLPFDPDSIKILNSDQQKAFELIRQEVEADNFANFLLYGITGSGKTEVYIHALKHIRESGRGGIVLVPEIALTPQTVARFYRIFGDEIAVLHSRMSARERLQQWQSLQKGEKKIAIGPRSAIFAPVQELGLIILDEEHDTSYKQMDPAPRYHAREVAIMRANRNKAVVIMGSATPSMQALHMAAKGKAEMLELNERHADAKLPEVTIIDLTQYKKAMRGPLSVALFKAMEEALSWEEQIILLYNRRGFASYLQCNDCGHIPQSPECSVSLTYHKRKNMLMCHYSGYARRADTHCEKCGSPNLVIQGAGTQKIEEELGELFPEARILRFDKDTTSRKGSHEKILGAFARREADILVGTQLVSKGLDFPDVTVVGVVDADTEQAFPSYTSSERLYQLLSQVAGRSGRGEKPGKVFIQTRQADNAAIQFAKEHDHRAFAREEMGFRKELNYPPFSRLIQFVLKGKEEADVSKAAVELREVIEQLLPEYDLLGPSASAISWMNRNYFWELTLKIDPQKGNKFIEGILDRVLEVYAKHGSVSPSKVRININVDAVR